MVLSKIVILSNMNMTFEIICNPSGFNLYVLYYCTGKATSNKAALKAVTFTIADHHFIGGSQVLAIQKITSKKLHWFLTVTIERKPTSQNYFEKKSLA